MARVPACPLLSVTEDGAPSAVPPWSRLSSKRAAHHHTQLSRQLLTNNAHGQNKRQHSFPPQINQFVPVIW